MAEVYVNSNSPIKHIVFWRGEPTDIDSGVPAVDIYRISGDPALVADVTPDTLLGTVTAEKIDTDTGAYQIFIPYSYTSSVSQLRLNWKYTVGGTAVQKSHVVFVVIPYVDITQTIEALGYGSDRSDKNYKSYFELANAEKFARNAIEGYTAQQFYTTDNVLVVEGSGADILPLPFRIVELQELYLNDVKMIDIANSINLYGYTIKISESQFALKVDKSSILDNTVYTANGMVPPTINQTVNGVFGLGQSFRVVGKFGWATVPDAVETACIELMKDHFKKDKWKNKYVDQVSTAGWSFKYSPQARLGTGNVEVDKMLSPYVLTQMMVI